MTGNNSTGDVTSRGLYRAVCALAAVSCAFTLLVGILLVSNLMTIHTASPLNLTEIETLRTSLKVNPVDEAVRTKIRDLDLVARHFYFNGLAVHRTGVFLLLGGMVVSLVSLRTMARLRRRHSDPRDYPSGLDPVEAASVARWTMAGVIVAVLTAGLYLAFEGGRRTSGGGQPPVPAQAVIPVAPGDPALNWPAFRGLTGSGVAVLSNAPVSWDGATGTGLLWKASVPLPGMSSPVVWGNHVFLTGATEEKREVYCYDIATGTLLWRMPVTADPGHAKEVPEVNKDTGFAAPTSVTDGRLVYSVFANGDLVAVDYCSRQMWARDFGIPINRYGYSSSLAWYGDKVLLQYDHNTGKGKTSQLIALDALTGKTVWTVPRPVTDSWPSPVVVNTEKGPQVITVANDAIIAYDPAAGRELWRVKCSGSDVAPSPIYAGGLVVASITADKIYAIRPDGVGDVTATHVAWTSEEGVTDVASPVSNGELVFFVHSSGLVICLEAKTGKKLWEQSLEGEFYGSPGLAGDRLYLAARNGQVFVLRAGRKYELIGKASLGEPSDGSPIFSGNRILIRGIKTLFCIGAREP